MIAITPSLQSIANNQIKAGILSNDIGLMFIFIFS